MARPPNGRVDRSRAAWIDSALIPSVRAIVATPGEAAIGARKGYAQPMDRRSLTGIGPELEGPAVRTGASHRSRLLISIGSLPRLLLRNLEISLGTGRSLVRLN